jgi:hypothetical protein
MSQDKQSAIEAAARATYEQSDHYYGTWDSLDPSLREYAIKNAGVLVVAYLNALVEDEGAAEAVLAEMLRWDHGPEQARAVLRTLATRAQGESS